MAQGITIEQVKELRDATGISIMQCRKALEEAEGDMNKALAILKKTSADIALKKTSREVKDGAIAIRTKGDKTIMLSLHSETDFVARNEDFLSLLQSLAEKALEEGVEKMQKESGELINLVIQKTGENIQLGEVHSAEGTVGSYVHNNKIGVIVELEGGNSALGKDIAMHVAAMKPEFISREDIGEEAKKMMAEVFMKEVDASGKPEEIKNKILEGKLSSYFRERTLLDQPFFKEPEITIGELLGRNNAKIKKVVRLAI